MALCAVCRNIPPHFFSSLPENYFDPSGRELYYHHHTATALRASAANGCMLCKIMVRTLRDGWLPQDVKDSQRLTMKRAVIDSVQAFMLAIGLDDISHYCFYEVPSRYSLPGALIDDNNKKDFLMRHWIDDCIRNHVRCNEERHLIRPARLLDVTSHLDSGAIALVELPQFQEQHLRYTTLSYCWGSPTEKQLTTTFATLPQRKEHIPYRDLPQTHKDAIDITRKLKIPYIWIDALCIIQDSADDWEIEAAKMASIYAGSVCTLSALSASNTDQGFLQETGETLETAYRYDLRTGDRCVRVFAAEPTTWDLYGPLMGRAWTLQERALSNRIIHFSQSQMLWECKTSKGSEELPWIGYAAYDSTNADKLLYDHIAEASGRHIETYKMRESWFSIVEDYSQRQLTYDKDKLIALSGLAHYHDTKRREASGLRDGSQNVYVAGLWVADMPSALLWRTDQRASRITTYGAPSWSWACLNGKVLYDSQRSEELEQDGGIWYHRQLPANREPSEWDFASFRIQEVNVTTSSADVMGAVTAGHLILKGQVFVAKITPKVSGLSEYSLTKDVCTWLSDLNNNIVGALFADVQTEVQSTTIVHCVNIRNEVKDPAVKIPSELENEYRKQYGSDHQKQAKVMGLGLVSHMGTSGLEYRRLGIVRWMPKDRFEITKKPGVKIRTTFRII